MSELLKTVPAGRSRGSGIREACPSQGEVKRGKRRFAIAQQSRGSKWEGKKEGSRCKMTRQNRLLRGKANKRLIKHLTPQRQANKREKKKEADSRRSVFSQNLIQAPVGVNYKSVRRRKS